MSGERAKLASAVLLGAREQLDPDRNEGYLVTGTIHILSISGLHVGILAAGFFVLLRSGVAKRGLTLLITVVLTFAYALLTDLEPPMVRACVLVAFACLGLWTGRSALGFNSLAAAAIVVLALNPASLFLAGPQLSFLAVATMIVFQPLLMPRPIDDPLDRLIAQSRPWAVRKLRGLASFCWRVWLAGALIWLVSTPLVWRQYNLISPVALALNFALWVPVTLAMYCGMGTLVLGAVAPPLARPMGIMCDRSIGLLESIIELGRTWPGAYFWLPAPPAWWIAMFYAVLLAMAALPALRPPRRWAFSLIIAWVAGAVWLSGGASSTGLHRTRPLRCQFVAVGHGVCVLIEYPDGRNLLYDAGRLGSPLAGARPIASVLWSRGISHLDAIVISHADADHFNAIPALLQRFSVGAIYVSPVMFERLPPAVEELRQAIQRAGVPIRTIHGGQRLAASPGMTVEVLHPQATAVYGSDNANSIVLLVTYLGRRILLTGDLEPPGLDDVLAETPLDCDVVLAPHHGSPRSNPGRFADWCRPEQVVISGRIALGERAATERVKHSLRLRGADVLHTAEDGCVWVEITDQGVAASTYRPHVRSSAAAISSEQFLQSE